MNNLSNEYPKFNTNTDWACCRIALKPGGGAGVLGNWQQLDTLFKLNNFTNTKIDTLDEKEQTFFNTTSIIPFLKEHQEPLKLFLPKEENETLQMKSRH